MPEAADGGPIARLRDGDRIRIDAEAGRVEALVDPVDWDARDAVPPDAAASHTGVGRELFGLMRAATGTAEQGGCSLFPPLPDAALADMAAARELAGG